VFGVGVHGSGDAKISLYAESGGTRTLIGTGRTSAIGRLQSEHWKQVTAERPTSTTALVVEWTASGAAPTTVTELAVWVVGRAADALSEAAVADRLVTELPENAIAATAAPWSASVARVTPDGPVSASFTLKLNHDPSTGRAFLVYELAKKAHWTGAARSINGHVVRGGYRAGAQGLGGVQVEEINPAWLKQGENTISFQPTFTEDGLGYNVRDVRIVSVPRGVDAAPERDVRAPLSDGDLSTGVGGPGLNTASLGIPANREPAFLSFYLNKPTRGTLTVSANDQRARRKGQVSVDLQGRPAGWQTVPVAGLPSSPALGLRVMGDRENEARVTEARLHWFPALTSPTDLAVSYPLHGECQNHKTYVRGFVAGPGRVQKPQLLVDGKPMVGKIDADGSFEADVAEPADARGKPWSIRLDVASDGGGHRMRTIPVDTCVEPPNGRVIGVSPPVEDVGAPYGAVVSPDKASTLAFAGAQIDIPAGAVDGDVRVTMRALDRAALPPIDAEMDNATPGGGALRFGPHGLKFKKPVKVTLPIDAGALPRGMTSGDVVAFFFDEATRKWTPLPKVVSRPDRVVAETTHFTDFIASTIRTPDHPDVQQFNPNTMKGVKAGEPGAGITLIQPPEASSSGSAHLSYPIETPPGRNGIGPHLALTYDSDRVNANGWLGVGWDLRMSSIEIDTRFGVPKYDGTETYMIDGTMLVPTQAPAGAPSGGQYYARRIEGAFDWIQRQGGGPTNYSWTVTDKKGTVYTYGSPALNCGTFVTPASCNSRLANPNSGRTANIFRWYLEKVRDQYGNVMTITYLHDKTPTNPAPTDEVFDAVYPMAIDYTSSDTSSPKLAPNYHVTFTLDTLPPPPGTPSPPTRPDIKLNGRPGFIEVTQRRLTDVVVKSGTTVVRQYHFDYLSNLSDTMQKSVLADVALFGPTGASSELYRHTFEYNKAPAAAAMFSGQQTWGQVTQPAPGGAVPRTSNGLTHSSDDLSGEAVLFGFGIPTIMATGSFGIDSGGSTPDLSFLSIAGQGLPDQIDSAGGLSQNAWYDAVGVAPSNHFGAGSVTGLPGIGNTSRSGWTAGGNISVLQNIYGLGASYGRHLSMDNGIVTDIDGDGFADVVYVNGTTLNAYINDGKQGFSFKQWTNYDLSSSPFTTANRVAEAAMKVAFFNTDPLIRWVAPFTGTVTINATATKVSTTGDDVSVELYVANSMGTSTVSSTPIGATDLGQHVIASNVSKPVSAGDRIYVRLAVPNNGVSDGALISTSIAYAPPTGRNASEKDPTNLPIFTFGSGNDFRAAGMPNVPWHLTGDGDIAVARCFSKSPTPDDVTVSYVIRHKLDPTKPTTYSQLFAAASASTSTTPLCFDPMVLPPWSSDSRASNITGIVHQDDSVSLEIKADSPVDPNAVNPAATNSGYTMAYTKYCRLGTCGPPQRTGSGYSIANDPYAVFPIAAREITYGLNGDTKTRPFHSVYVWSITNNGLSTPQPIRSVSAPSSSVTFGGSVTTKATLTEDVIVLIQGHNRLYKKVPLRAGTAANTTVSASTGSITITPGDPVLFFTIYSPTGAGTANVTWSPTMNGAAVSSLNVNKAILDPVYDNNLRSPTTPHDPLSGGYHRWFYGDWNHAVVPFSDSLVKPVTIPQNTDPVMGSIPMDVNSEVAEQSWLGRGNAQLFGDDVLFNGTVTVEAIPGQVANPVAIATSGGKTQALRVSDTWNVDVTAKFNGVTAGGNGGDSTTQVDFLDLNGDRYPDSITNGGIQYNQYKDGTQSFSPRIPVDAGFGDLRSIFNASIQAGVSVGTGTDRQLINEPEGASAPEPEAVGRTKKLSASVALSGTADYGVSSTRIDFADVNGDGLIDHVMEGPSDGKLRVKLNLGYGFSNEVTWSAAGWSQPSAVAGWPSLPGAPSVDPVGSVLNTLIPGSPTSTNVLRLQDTGTISLAIGGNLSVVGGGGGPNWTVTRKWVDLVDVNGDGLPDQVLKIPGDPALLVKINTGNGFAAEQRWTLPSWNTATDINFAFLSPDGLGFSTINGWGENLSFELCFFVCIGFSGFKSESDGGMSADLEDIDGDGDLDQVLKVPGDANVYAKLNNLVNANSGSSNVGPVNLLSAVNRPEGGRIEIAYERFGNYVNLTGSPRVNMPSTQWVLGGVVVHSSTTLSSDAPVTETFTYRNPTTGLPTGYYDPVERENLGYGYVKTRFPFEDVGGTAIMRNYFNQDYYLHGLESAASWFQNDHLSTQLRSTLDSYADPSKTPGQQTPPRTGTFFPAPVSHLTYINETGPISKSHYLTRTFDKTGNLTDLIDYGDYDLNDPSDDYNYHVDYFQNQATNVVVPSGITVRTGTTSTGALLAKRTAATFDASGKPKTITDVIVNGKDPATGNPRTETSPGNATWTFTYDGYGNVQTASSPERSANPCPTCGRTLNYTYDATTQTYPLTAAQTDYDTTDSQAAAYSSSATYDLRFGLPLTLTDVAGGRQQICYDNYGRVTKVFAPSDLGTVFENCATTTKTPTIGVTYSEAAHAASGFVESLPAWAMATHTSSAPGEGSLPGAATTPIAMRTVSFVDGLSRTLQTKKDISRDPGGGTAAVGMGVSGNTIFDGRGRVYQQGQPFFVAGGTTPTAFVAVSMSNPTQYAYDMLGRLRQEQHPDSGTLATTKISYQIAPSPVDGRNHVLKMITDPLNAADPNYHYRQEFRDVRDEMRVRYEPNLINNAFTALITTYDYDQLGRVVRVADAGQPSANLTVAQYDTVGNLVSLTNPDTGAREWRYCVGGYVCAEQSANMLAVTTNPQPIIRYAHDRDRIKTITYPHDQPVTYTYGAASQKGSATTKTGYKANRVTQRIDEAGLFTYDYDGLGDVASETATLFDQTGLVTTTCPAPLPSGGKCYQAYTTGYTWDNFGRLIEVAIPGTSSNGVNTPAEMIRYGYDAGGAVTSARGLAAGNNTPFDYVTHVGYSEFGDRTFITYGNQTYSAFGYAADTRRLVELHTAVQDSAGQRFTQLLLYGYDLVGNVRTRSQSLPLDSVATNIVPVGGSTNGSFTYDPLNQLVHADMTIQTKQSESYRATEDMTYDRIGNITNKAQSSLVSTFDKQGNLLRTLPVDDATHYTFTPTYRATPSSPPHAPNSVAEAHYLSQSTRLLTYDLDGNRTSSTYNGTGQGFTWSDTDRLRSICSGTPTGNCPPISQALYTADGVRTHNKVTAGTSSTETLYVNQYLTVRNGALPTKHVYLGDMRIASKMDVNATTNSTYWYHTDNLQSAQYVTTTGQALVQHLEYFPSGQIWHEEYDGSRLLIQKAQHGTSFTGKEIDPSGYYYFGARYYEPQLQVWLSPDPILGRYIREGADGATPANLALYTYAHNNPVILRDPTGLRTDAEIDAKEYRRQGEATAAATFESAVEQGAERAVKRWGYTNTADIAAYATLSAEGGDTSFDSVRARANAIGPSLITGGDSDLTSGVKIRDTSGAYEFISQQITFAALSTIAGEALGALGGGAEGPRVLGRGFTANLSKGRTLARNLREQLAVEQAMSNPAAGEAVAGKMGDFRWNHAEGWTKMHQVVRPGGSPIDVHYMFNEAAGAMDDFKVVMPGH
jgi:RHS repeat-associated protein